MKKKLIWIPVILLAATQLIPRPSKNESKKESDADISRVLGTSSEVSNILKTSCYDCHSNNTSYPWYTGIQPLSIWIGHHIEEGKESLNFSEFKPYSIRKKYHKLEEIVEQVEENEMPLSSYTMIHTKARLNANQKNILIQWAQTMMDSIKMHTPPDSLVRKKRQS